MEKNELKDQFTWLQNTFQIHAMCDFLELPDVHADTWISKFVFKIHLFIHLKGKDGTEEDTHTHPDILSLVYSPNGSCSQAGSGRSQEQGTTSPL